MEAELKRAKSDDEDEVYEEESYAPRGSHMAVGALETVVLCWSLPEGLVTTAGSV